MECVNVSGKCRACRIKTQKEFQIPIFTTENLQLIFHEATSLEIHENDGLPEVICEDCHKRLLEAYKFRQMCASSALAFRQIISGDGDGDFEEKYKPPEVVGVPSEGEVMLPDVDVCFPEVKFNPLEALVDAKLPQEDDADDNLLDTENNKDLTKGKRISRKRICRGKNDKDPLESVKDDPDWTENSSKSPKRAKVVSIKPRKMGKKKQNALPRDNDGAAGNGEEQQEDEKKPEDPPSSFTVEYVCKVCGKKYTKREGLKSHMRFTHPGVRIERTVMECNLCGKKYNKIGSLQNHMKVCHQGLNLAKCTLCDKEFKSNDGLKGHMVRYHGANDMIRCTECTKVFSTKEGLENHIKEWHDPENPKEKPKNYMCDLCGKAFASPAALLRHTNSHAGIKPYQCSVCPRAYQTKHRLKVHMMRHEGIKEHVCTVCGLRKTTGTELRTHMNLHNKDKVYPCGLCPKIFYAHANYNLHVRTVHQGIKAYSCPHCEQSFARAGTLKHHVMTHTGEKPHACEECGKRFIQLTALNTHKRTHGTHRKIK
ncbi:zinc finger protein ZFP2-like [Lutzomyia longipalpis]|uniref:zinc finger protein ZFP2-like n=1 Tax=Lutzomyia longipalpis TaxID=7200 RepID=UPI0024836CC7|nr:zinc finger protein ZFP2-like [Lutzomyia longipalpis]